MSRSRASHVRALRREVKRPGRPKGSRVSLLANPRRFAIAVWRALQGLGLNHPYDISALVTVLIEETTPITIESIDSFLVAVSAKYPSPSMTTFNARIDRLVRDARALPVKVEKREADCCLAGHCRRHATELVRVGMPAGSASVMRAGRGFGGA